MDKITNNILNNIPKKDVKDSNSSVSNNVDIVSSDKSMSSNVIDINVLKKSGFVPKTIKNVKIFLSGKLDKKIDVKGLMLSKGAKEAIESIGGSIS